LLFDLYRLRISLLHSEMDAIRKAAERVEQSVLETVGSASKTELSPLLLEKLKMADDIKVKCEKLVHAME
ncbi:hypothetical protein PRIPAC_91085, partial [Pristionchus pacificus]